MVTLQIQGYREHRKRTKEDKKVSTIMEIFRLSAPINDVFNFEIQINNWKLG